MPPISYRPELRRRMVAFYESRICSGKLRPTDPMSSMKHIKTLARRASRIIRGRGEDEECEDVPIRDFIRYAMEADDKEGVSDRLAALFRNDRANRAIPSIRDPLRVSAGGATPMLIVSGTNELAYESALTLLNVLSYVVDLCAPMLARWPRVHSSKLPPYPPVKDDAERRCPTLDAAQSLCQNAPTYCEYVVADGRCIPAGR